MNRFPELLVNRLAFFPQKQVASAALDQDSTIQEVFLDTDDGIRLQSYLLRHPDSPHIVLFLHGNAGNAHHRLGDATNLRAAGANVLLLSYRGYGKSSGSPSERGLYRDAGAALSYIRKELGFEKNNTFILGRSIGSAVAIEAARGRDLAGLILVTPLSSGRELARVAGLGWLAWLVGSPFDSVSKVAELKCPALFIHGDSDRVVPLVHGERLFAVYPGDAKQFRVVPGADHNDLTQVAGERYWRWIGEFLYQASP